MIHYQVCRGSEVLMQATDESCRYPARAETALLEAGYEIYIDGKRIKKMGRKENGHDD